MKSHLEVAVGIADAINHAQTLKRPLDVEAEAAALSRNLEVPRVMRQMVAEILTAEGQSAGLTVLQAS